MKVCSVQVARHAGDLALAGALLAALLACGGGNSASPPAADPSTRSEHKSASERCYDACSGRYDSCSNGCLRTQLGASLGNFGNNAAVQAAGDQSQACLDNCNNTSQDCSAQCERIADQEINAATASPADTEALNGDSPGASDEDETVATAEMPAGASDEGQSAAAGVANSPRCAACNSQCAAEKGRCQGGSTSACYRAAACLCRCNLESGGCGSTQGGLQQCVQDNESKAEALKSNVPTFAFSKGATQARPAPPPVAVPSSPRGCPGGAVSCASAARP